MKEFFLGMVVGFVFGYMTLQAFDVPVVYKSHSTGQCVQVFGAGSCDDLPKRYDLVWVK